MNVVDEYMSSGGFSVCLFDQYTKEGLTCLYDCIETVKEAYILAQYSMIDKRPDQLICIMPGWNIDIKSKGEMYNQAVELSKKYKQRRALS